MAQIVVGGGAQPPHVQEVTVGSTAQFQVSLRDLVGYAMKVSASEHGDWVVSNSNPAATVATLEGSSLAVTASAPGSTVVRVEDRRDARLTAYMVVYAGNFIEPSSPRLYMGAVVHFTLNEQLQHLEGEWWSENTAVVRVDAATGVASAVAEGSAAVHFRGPELSTFTYATVVRVASVSISPPSGERVLTNVLLGWDYRPDAVLPSAKYRFPVSFSDMHRQPVLKSNKGLVRHTDHVDYNCQVFPASIGVVKPITDGAGSAMCELDLFDPSKGAAGSQDVTVVEVVARLQGGRSDGSPVEGRVSIPYVGGFQLEKSTPKVLKMNARHNRTLIQIVGNAAAVEASWGRRDVLSVDVAALTSDREGLGLWLQQATHRTCKECAGAVFRVGVRVGAPSFADTITLSIPATNQRVELHVAYTAGGVRAVLSSTASTLSSVMAVVAAAGIAYYVYLQKQEGHLQGGQPRNRGGRTSPQVGFVHGRSDEQRYSTYSETDKSSLGYERPVARRSKAGLAAREQEY
eukprot:7714144-Pyramimonas_sp.AAC.1